MQKIISLVLILTTIFFMTGCGSSEELDIPGIELVGNIVMEIEQYSEFVDPGATILGDFNIDVVIDSDVDTSTLGDYTITYTITYESIEYVVSRTVRVVEEFSGDTPGLRFVGDTTIVIEQYSDFLDPGVEIIGEFGLDVVVDSNVDVNTIGTYEIVYTISYMEIDYNLTRYVEVVEADTGDSLVLTEDYYSLSEDYFGIEFLYDDTGFSSIHMWAEIYKDGVYIDTDVIYDYTYFDFYDLDPETDYVVNVYANYTTTSDFVEHYRTEVMVYEITTDAAPIVPVVENIIITRTSDSITVEFDLIDSGDIMKSAYLYIVRGWSNAAIAEVFVGHNLITFNEYIDENTFYEIVISANYTFNDDPAIYEGEVYTPPVITVDSFTGTKMFFGNDNVIMKLELDNYEKVTINAVTINGITYDSFKFPSNNIDTLYIDMGVYTDLGTHPMNLSEIIITLGEEEYKIEVNVSAEVPVYLAGSIVPEEATVGVLEIVPDKYHVNISFDDRTEISTVGVSVYLDNPFELPVSSITIGGVTYSGSDLNVISFTQVRFTAEFSFDDSPSNNSLYFNSISFTKNGDVVNSTNSGTGDVTVSIRKVYDTDTSDEFPIIVLISTPGDLMDMEDSAARPGTVFRLTNDIDMTGYAFIPFGTSADSFGAMFDGNGYTISNVTINKTLSVDSDYNYIGFFGNAISFVTNLTLDNINITVSTTEDNTVYVGILAGKLIGDVINVNVVNSTITIDGMVKGDVGGMFGTHHGDIIGSSADTDIYIISTYDVESYSTISVGGLVGIKAVGDVRNSYANGDIYINLMTRYDVMAGGLIGSIYNGGMGDYTQYVKNSYATGDILSTGNYYSRFGGLIGVSDIGTVILNSYASGDVNASAGTRGGLIGQSYSRVISSFATGTMSGENGSMGRLFGIANDYRLINIYVYDEQLLTRDGITEIGGNDKYYLNIGVAGWEQFNDPDYYTEFLGWSPHFFSFINLIVSDDVLPLLK